MALMRNALAEDELDALLAVERAIQKVEEKEEYREPDDENQNDDKATGHIPQGEGDIFVKLFPPLWTPHPFKKLLGC